MFHEVKCSIKLQHISGLIHNDFCIDTDYMFKLVLSAVCFCKN